MKYQPPYGVSNPDAPYINGDPTVGRQGSIPPAATFEYPMREIVGVISKSMLNPTDADLLQMAKGVRSQRMNYAEDSGGVNSLVVAYDPPIGAYTLGLVLHVRVRNKVTGPSTINAGAGTVNVIRADGSILQDGDLPANCIAGLIFDGTSFQVMNFFGVGGGTGGAITTYITKLPYVVDTGTVPGQILAPFAPAFTELVAGDAMLVKLKNTCPGLSTIRVNALPPKPVLASDSSQCLQGDYIAGDVKLFVYDGTQFYIQPNPLITASITMNVPAQYPTFANAMALLQRKMIAQDATVTIKFAAGVFPGIIINHHDGDRIVVAGTMIGAIPTPSEYVPSNPNQNIAMLRTRYGTEIQPGAGIGLQNQGRGTPNAQDILIVGGGAGSYGVAYNAFAPQINCSLNCYNINAWGCSQGFYGTGYNRLNTCAATSCAVGFGSINGGVLGMSTCYAIACSSVNYLAMNHSEIVLYGGVCNYSGGIGHEAGNGSHIDLNSTTAIGNNSGDCVAFNASVISTYASVIGTSSPAFNTEGNMSSIVTQ